jgi:signal recognition particle receptor subunit beta
MAFVNYATGNLAIKIVYYGPGLSGKTTNLRYIYTNMDADFRGELICLETDTERTLFFDLLPIKAGVIDDFKIHLQLMTVPGQVFYAASRKSVLKGVDGIVFVADSQIPLLDANLESFDGLRRNLLEHSVDINHIPLVFQYNKRDLDNLIPVETFNSLLNPSGLPYIETCAIKGKGVFETLKEITKLAIPMVKEKIRRGKRSVADKGPPEKKKEKDQGVPAKDVPELREEIKFVAKDVSAPLRVTKVKFKSQKDIEKELENLAKDFTKSKK